MTDAPLTAESRSHLRWLELQFAGGMGAGRYMTAEKGLHAIEAAAVERYRGSAPDATAEALPVSNSIEEFFADLDAIQPAPDATACAKCGHAVHAPGIVACWYCDDYTCECVP